MMMDPMGILYEMQMDCMAKVPPPFTKHSSRPPRCMVEKRVVEMARSSDQGCLSRAGDTIDFPDGETR